MYQLTDVSKRFEGSGRGVTALEHVNLTVAAGELLAVQGPTGQGKTTLLQLLGGLDRPTSGSISFDGRDLGALTETELSDLRARAFGFVFQTFNLIPTLTAQENVEVALVPLHVGRKERRERAVKQRVAIARALVKDPKVLLADEPTGNLDEEMRDEIISLLEGLWRDRGLTLLVVTHDSVVAKRAARVALIRKGRLTIRETQPAVR
jgi:putative ABC transport system ATP-binding protein